MRTLVIDGVAGATFAMTSAATAGGQGIAASVLSTTSGRKIEGMLVECDPYVGYTIRYSFGGTLPVKNTMHKLAPGSVVEIKGYANCASFLFINDVDLENAVLYITPKY